LTRPRCTASAASNVRPVRINSMALFGRCYEEDVACRRTSA
jgi:hypothetical protein